MNKIVNWNNFIPLVPFIRSIDVMKMFIEFELPNNITIDSDYALLFFKSDSMIKWIGGKWFFSGTVKDADVFNALLEEYNKHDPNNYKFTFYFPNGVTWPD